MKKEIMRILAVALSAVVLVGAGMYIGRAAGLDLPEEPEPPEVQEPEQETKPEPVPEPKPLNRPDPEPEPEPEPKPEPEPEPPQIMEKYLDLYEENSDLIGWLKIDGTKIDYPIMYTPQEKDKYLNLGWDQRYSVNGSLYLDEDDDIWTSDNLIIYGHHMKNGDMFGDLDYYERESYWKEHPYITFDTLYDERTYEVVAAFYARILYTYETGFRYYYFIDAEDEEDFNRYRDFIEANQCYDTGIDISYGDQLLTLSTCAYHTTNGRFAVVARLVTPNGEPALDKQDVKGSAD